MNVLIIEKDDDLAYIRKRIEAAFPGLTVLAAASEGEVGDFIQRAEILLSKRISDELLSRAKNLKWIHSMLTGVDSFARLPAFQKRKDLLLTSSRGIHGPQMSEMALLLMLALNRRLPENIRNQERRRWERWPGALLWRKKVGILGMGVIGKAIAEKCKAFGMTVFGVDQVEQVLPAVDLFFGPEALPTVLQEVDYFVNVVPAAPSTRKLVGRREFVAMKSTAFYISLGRGETVDEAALIDALRTGEIAGAALDVFETEPLPEDSPLWEMKNVIITPHIGGWSDIYAEQILPVFEENMRRYLNGQQLLNLTERS